MHTLLGRVLLGGRLRLVASPDGCWCYDLLARHMTVDASRTQERMSALPARLRASPGTFCTAAGERLLVPANPVCWELQWLRQVMQSQTLLGQSSHNGLARHRLRRYCGHA